MVYANALKELPEKEQREVVSTRIMRYAAPEKGT